MSDGTVYWCEIWSVTGLCARCNSLCRGPARPAEPTAPGRTNEEDAPVDTEDTARATGAEPEESSTAHVYPVQSVYARV